MISENESLRDEGFGSGMLPTFYFQSVAKGPEFGNSYCIFWGFYHMEKWKKLFKFKIILKCCESA